MSVRDIQVSLEVYCNPAPDDVQGWLIERGWYTVTGDHNQVLFAHARGPFHGLSWSEALAYEMFKLWTLKVD